MVGVDVGAVEGAGVGLGLGTGVRIGAASGRVDGVPARQIAKNCMTAAFVKLCRQLAGSIKVLSRFLHHNIAS